MVDWGKGGENRGVSERRWWGFKMVLSHDLNSPVWKSASLLFFWFSPFLITHAHLF